MTTTHTVEPVTGDDAARPAQADFDVLIVGAGLSGIDAAYHLRAHRPDLTFTILEGRDSIGGTWDFFRYPGIRSDSDVPTFGYHFKPWRRKTTISPARPIMEYLHQAVEENGLRDTIRLGYRVLEAQFSRERQLWTVTARHTATGEPLVLRARFLFLSCGYYDYENPHRPSFAGEEDFDGPIIHPQLWPEDLDYAGKRIVVIGSGATAATVVPAMAPQAGHVTMLQRSPTYYFTRPEIDRVGMFLTRVLGSKRAYPLIRRKNIGFLKLTYAFSRRFPERASRMLIGMVRRQLPEGFDVDTHFTPRYKPWDERMCLIPGGRFFSGGDLFKEISAGRVSIVTDHIDRFTKTGILLKSGRELPADIIVAATGITMVPLGKIALTVDGEPVDLPQTQVYKTTMLSRVPNMMFAFGYAQLSWTLRVDLVCQHFIRLLDHMKVHGYGMVEPIFDGHPMQRQALIGLQSNYAKRGAEVFPYGGGPEDGPWSVEPDYDNDIQRLCVDAVDDPALTFTPAKAASGVVGQRVAGP